MGADGTDGTARTPDGLVLPPPPPPEPRTAQPAIARPAAVRLAEAAFGLAAVTTRRALDVAAAAATTAEGAASVVVRAGTSATRRTGVARRIDRLAAIGRAEQRRNERAAALFLQSALRRSVARVVAATDVDAVVARLDISALVERVLDDIDLGRIVRESSTGVAAETVDAVRLRSADADRALSGFVDRVVLRRPPRDGSVPAAEPGRAPP